MTTSLPTRDSPPAGKARPEATAVAHPSPEQFPSPAAKARLEQPVLVVLEQRFCQTPDGRVWTPATNAYDFWQRYLAVFDRVKVVARVQPTATVPEHWRQANGPQVDFVAIPYYVGPFQYAQKRAQIRRAMAQALCPGDAVILRVSSQLASCLLPWLHRYRHPYAVEVVADPYDVFAPGAMAHPLRPYFRWRFTRALEQQCAGAIAAAYVTESALQQRYPSPHYAIGVSDVELGEASFAPAPRRYQARNHDTESPRRWELLYVGTLAQLYKAPHILIDAFAATCLNRIDAHLTLVGDGPYRAQLTHQVERLGISDRVTFAGQLPPEQVQAALAQADLFVLPSFQEGLPRALVEAMAQGLPCLGSRVGGVPELLADEDLVTAGDVAELSRQLCQVLSAPERLNAMAQRNWSRAQAFRSEVLQPRRLDFYKQVRQATEAWQRQGA